MHQLSYSQNNIATKERCTDVMAQNAGGRWIKSTDLGTVNSKEAYNRLDEIQNMILKLYPQPTGVDAVWHRAAGMSYFGNKLNPKKWPDGRVTFEYSNLPHFIKYYYSAGFFRYSCEYNKTNTMVPGYPGETGTWLTITANETLGPVSEVASDDKWTINGLPVRMRPPVLKTIRGFEVQYPEPGSNTRYVLIRRNGVLPYIPVTRKQYLDQCIIYHTKLWDEMISGFVQLPVRSAEEQEKEKKAKLDKFQKDFGNDPKRLKSAVDYYLSGYQTDQQQRDEKVRNAKKNKEDELKKFSDELEKTTNDGLLDAPAVVGIDPLLMNQGPVFQSEAEGGCLLATENPNYFRKELPKYVPQLFVIELMAGDPQHSNMNFKNVIEENFPIEKLKAMIDK